MKCDILCIKCYKDALLASAIHTKDLIITEEDLGIKGYFELPLPIPEEREYHNGQALREFHCDLCGKPIVEGEECVARTIIGYGQTYVPWEHGYVK